ncbi:hypothetical protein Q7689_30480 [Nocardiopsis tropica]|nr:hypothetical protein [Nocardiopsis tropica]
MGKRIRARPEPRPHGPHDSESEAAHGSTPSAAYHVEVAEETEIVGTVSGGGEIRAEIAAMTLKDNGLVAALEAALDHVIEGGEFQEAVERWAVGGEAVTESETNPPGLPRS